MKHAKRLMMCMLGCLVGALVGADAVGAGQDPSIQIYFKPGKAFLSSADKSELRRLFQTYELGPQGRVFVVGYTDARGTRAENYRLSRQRAEAVRQEIIGAFGVDGGIVMALGKGMENPAAGNKTAKGRALNRRAEIYLVNAQSRRSQQAFGPDEPNWDEVQNLVREAEASIKARHLERAVQKLNKAYSLGGDRYSDWHALWGIAGYYAAASPEEIRAHLILALNLDPYNFNAREYLSRLEARQKVARGEVTEDMGRSVETAIDITTIAQQYEYLSLFKVEPLVHRDMEMHPVDMWQCMDRQGAPVVYYFNHSQAYQWAFARTAAETAPLIGQGQSKSLEQAVSIGKDAPRAPSANPSALSTAQNPGKIWESKLFKFK